MEKAVSYREAILNNAIKLTTGDRDATYGDPYINMNGFAELVSAYLNLLGPSDTVELDATDAAVIMTLAKISRIAVNKNHEDNYVDGAAYLAIAGECAPIRQIH